MITRNDNIHAGIEKLASMNRHKTGSPQHSAYMKRTARRIAKKHGLQMNQGLVNKMRDIHFLHVAKSHYRTPKAADSSFRYGIQQEFAGKVSSPGGGRFTKKTKI